MNETLPDDEPLFPEADIVYAKFWPRLGASLIDTFILVLITVPLTYYNVIAWKIPGLFIMTSLFTICYKPGMEFRYGATLGKMAVGILIVGNQFQRVTLKEELMRVSFYLVPSIIQELMTAPIYFSGNLNKIHSYHEYNNYIAATSPALYILNIIVFILLVIDCITFFSNEQKRSLHDLYAGTYVIESEK
ncbi:MAG: RDD family protein [Bacteroidota bacterium]|nr:RDD family protein [Bacteroidota bacterium]